MVKEYPSNSFSNAFDLKKKSEVEEEFDISQVTIKLSYVVARKKSLCNKLFNQKEKKIDIDLLAFLLDINGKVEDKGRTIKTSSGKTIEHYNGDIIFFNSVKHQSGNIWLTGDPLSGTREGNEEQIVVRLNSLHEKYQKIVFAAALFQSPQKQEDLNFLKNSCLKVLDTNGKEIIKHSLDQKINLSGMSSVILCEIFRKNGNWSFKYVGIPLKTVNISNIIEQYI